MKKVNTKTKVIALSTAAVMTTAIYLKSDNVTNAEQYAQVSDNAIELNVDKQNKDTIKLSLSNFSDLAKSLQLSVKIEGNAIFTDDSIKWLVKSQNDDLKTDVKISADKKQMDIFILSNSNIEIDGGLLEICEINVAKENKNSTEGYTVVPNVNSEGIAYNYIIDGTNKQVKGSDIVNSSKDKLTVNTAPVISLVESPKIVEGNIIIKTGDVFKPLEYVKATDDEDGEEVNITANSLNVNNKKPGSYKVTYTATDKEGESTNLDVNVIVEEVQQSVSNPVMNITNKNIQIRQGDKFDPLAGVTATDYQGRKLTVNVTGSYDVEVVGSYVLTYTVTDTYGNTITDTATLEVVKQDAPVINGVKSNIEIKVGENFDLLDGVTATDFTGALIKVQVSEDYDISVPGEYTITYKAIDKYGNESEVKAILKVVEKPNNNQKPDDSGNKPDNGGNNPGDGVNKPDNGGSNPGDGVNKPNNGGSNPGDSVNKPDNGGSNPGNNINSSSNGTNTGQNTGNVNSGDSKNENVISENNNSTTNSSKIPTTGAAVGSGIIVSIGSVIALIGAYLFKKNR
ncbi:immunoglobulin-like domain-containing protein [Clostridium sp. CAG:265]|uniref:immunoglobulin-like domain-containing protein n=1 Tax=Clostridium sp. CAG:265 TaxID=1262787 RepID=UPI00033B2FC4|nr:immunoglobulin-like domain-containing protein [Clostridium sp. CAG:265]CDB75679.1 surface protein PspA [Clostridium sp. CAG:265]